jgi:hypothetical protein
LVRQMVLHSQLEPYRLVPLHFSQLEPHRRAVPLRLALNRYIC